MERKLGKELLNKHKNRFECCKKFVAKLLLLTLSVGIGGDVGIKRKDNYFGVKLSYAEMVGEDFYVDKKPKDVVVLETKSDPESELEQEELIETDHIMHQSLFSQMQFDKDGTIGRLFDSIKNNIKKYSVKPGDTLAQIAFDSGISFRDLIYLNYMLGNDLKVRGKNDDVVIIKVGQNIFVPRNSGDFKSHLSSLREIYSTIETNNILGNQDQSVAKTHLKKHINTIFSQRVQSFGLPNILKAIAVTQLYGFDIQFPRIVDFSREETVSCANMMRALKWQSVNIGDIKPQEKDYLQKQNIDAWMLPTELIKIGYLQEFSDLMLYFDQSRIGSEIPINPENIDGYQARIIALHNYLLDNDEDLIGSLVPFYFRYSRYKGVVAEYNRNRKDKHLNTHQTMFAGNLNYGLFGYESMYLKNGVPTNFGADLDSIKKQISFIEDKLAGLRNDFEMIRMQINKLCDLDNNHYLSRKSSTFDRVLQRLFTNKVKLLDGTEQEILDQDKLTQAKKLVSNITEYIDIKSYINSSQDIVVSRSNIDKNPLPQGSKFKAFVDFLIMSGIRMSYADIEYIANLINQKSRINKYLTMLSNDVSSPKDNLDYDGYGVLIGSDETLKSLMGKYNKFNKEIVKMQDDLREKKQSLVEQPTIDFIDFIANFIQIRADFSFYAFSDEYKKQIIDGLYKFADIIDIKVNGNKIDIRKQIESYRKQDQNGLKISSKDYIEIFGPLMIDGEHQSTHHLEDRRRKMNLRVRFLFEFIVAKTYFPTELLVPGKDSSFRKTNFGKIHNKIPLKGVYDLREGETLEEVLLNRIPVFEKISISDPDYRQKTLYHYSLQIKGLQISGFLQDENTLNPGAVKINRLIPYFDPNVIEQKFKEHVSSKKKSLMNEMKQMSDIRDYMQIQTFPYDTAGTFYGYIIEGISGFKARFNEYPNLKYGLVLNEFQKILFLNKFFEKAINMGKPLGIEQLLRGEIKPGSSYFISIKDLDKILGEVMQKSFIKEKMIPQLESNLVDTIVVNKQNQRIIKDAFYIERFGSNGGIPWLTFVKIARERLGYASSIGDLQLRLFEIRDGLDKEWPNLKHLEKAFAYLDSPEIKQIVESLNRYAKYNYEKDMKVVYLIRSLVSEYKSLQDIIDRNSQKISILKQQLEFGGESKSHIFSQISILSSAINIQTQLQKDCSGQIYDYLRELVLMDKYFSDGNIVGRIISISLLDDKISLHNQKLYWILHNCGEDVVKLLSNDSSIQDYEKIILYMNNVSENIALYAMCENYVLRILNSAFGLGIKTSSTFNTTMKGKIRGSIKYDQTVFLANLKKYLESIDLSKNSDLEQVEFISDFKRFIEDLQKDYQLNKRINNNTIFRFLSNNKVRKVLSKRGMSESVLVLPNEYRISPFHVSTFNYINKIYKSNGN